MVQWEKQIEERSVPEWRAVTACLHRVARKALNTGSFYVSRTWYSVAVLL